MRLVVSLLGAVAVLAQGCKNEVPPPVLTPPGVDAPAPDASPAPSTSGASASASTSASATPVSSDAQRCASDDDCVLSSFAGCCACCPCGPLVALTRAAEAARHEPCERKKCDDCKAHDERCVPCTDPAKEGMHARCRSGACILVETSGGAGGG